MNKEPRELFPHRHTIPACLDVRPFHRYVNFAKQVSLIEYKREYIGGFIFSPVDPVQLFDGIIAATNQLRCPGYIDFFLSIDRCSNVLKLPLR